MLPFFIGIALLACVALYLFCVIDLHKQPVKYQAQRSVWLNLIWGAPVAGCIIYLLNRKKIRRRANRTF